MTSVEGLSEGLNIIRFRPIELRAVRATGGTQGASLAHQKLENLLKRPIDTTYGVNFTPVENYFAGAEEDSFADDTASREPLIVPGGFYAEATMEGWQERIHMIGTALRALETRIKDARHVAGLYIDTSRPQVEVYRHHEELGGLALRIPIRTAPLE